MLEEMKKRQLQRLALEIRIGVLEEMKARGFGHVGGCLSICDLLAVLYGEVLRYDPQRPDWAERDKLVCSKGHAGPAVYAALAVKGFFPYEELKTLNQPGTRLPSHCDHQKTVGIDMTTGSLGQGASLAAGMALGDRLKGRDSRTYLIVGDGELNEGQAWEAAMFTAARRIDNLVWLVDNNRKQLDGYTKDVLNPFSLADKFKAFGFDVRTVDGGDVEQICDALSCPVQDRPVAVILNTVKGRGVPEVEGTADNHSMNLPQETWERWLGELREALRALDEEGGCGND